jgi:hypothetical protein
MDNSVDKSFNEILETVVEATEFFINAGKNAEKTDGPLSPVSFDLLTEKLNATGSANFPLVVDFAAKIPDTRGDLYARLIAAIHRIKIAEQER